MSGRLSGDRAPSSGSTVVVRWATSAMFSPRNGSVPVAAYSTTATQANTSDAAVARWPARTSGAMQPNVPMIAPVAVRDMSGARAMPKSMIRGPSGPSRTFPGLGSRCTTPAWWIADNAVATPVASRSTASGDGGPSSRTAAAARVGPATYSLTR